MGETAFGPKYGLIAEMRVTHLAVCDTARVERKYAAAAKHLLPRNATGTHTTAMMFCPIERRRFLFAGQPQERGARQFQELDGEGVGE